ncbi:MAG: Anaerobic sulfatase-maturating enzyme, partial [Haloplasmataceae bacterium]|nr:Anaerobic sulfatase-maturating enzyme [Haloplasmataceae bacterium]
MLYSEFLIKPASEKCNIDCEYCFYKDISARRGTKDYGFMALDTLETIVKRAYSETEKSVIFGFQGGEPLLVGIDYYIAFFEYIDQYNVNKIKTDISIQTNGTLINDEWAILFSKNHILIGISLDGPKEIHNIFRVDYKKNGTQLEVMNGIELLKKHHVEFNILTVISKYVARNIENIYQFFRDNHFDHIQFIEVLDRNFLQTGTERFSLNNKDYNKFLKDLFLLWYNDFNQGRYVSIRLFDVMIHKLLGNESAVPCFNKGGCQNQNIIEANGDVFSCDFYVTEDYLLGNIKREPLESILNNKQTHQFIKESVLIPHECITCKYYSLCRNGCKRYRVNHKYYYCEAIYNFYDTHLPKLLKLAEKVNKLNY